MSPSPFAADSFQVPDVAEPLRAFRAWDITAEGLLRGARGIDWEPVGHMTAACGSSAWQYYGQNFKCTRCPSLAQSGHAGHGCGIYGYTTPELLATHTRRVTDADAFVWTSFGGGATGSVWGEVEMWGEVMVHEGGYRAQHARIVRLFATDPNVETVAETYGVPVEPFPLTVAECAAIYAPPHLTMTFTIDTTAITSAFKQMEADLIKSIQQPY